MKKLIMASAICVASLVFAQEAAETTPAPEAPAKCECGNKKMPPPPCADKEACAPKCGDKCGKRMPPPPCAMKEGCRRGPQCPPREGFRPDNCAKGQAPACQMAASPRVKKCDCSPDCKGVIILPPNSTEGEPLFMAPQAPCQRGEGFRRGPRGKFGHRPDMKGQCPGKMPPPPPALPASPEGGVAPVAPEAE